MHSRVKIGLIGNGNWGKNYITTAKNIDNLSLIDVTEAIKEAFHSTNLDYAVNKIFRLKKLSGFIIAISPIHQPRILIAILKLKIPVIVEKPLCMKKDDLEKINQLCLKNNIVFVNHFHFFLQGFKQLEKKISSDEISKIFIQDGNNGPVRKGVSSLFDWGPHAIGVCLKLMNEFPNKVEHYKPYRKASTNILHTNWKIKLSFSSKRTCFLIIGNKFNKKKRMIKIFLKNKIKPIIIENNEVRGTTCLTPGLEKKTQQIILPMEDLLHNFITSIKNGVHDKNKTLKIASMSTTILLGLEKLSNEKKT